MKQTKPIYYTAELTDEAKTMTDEFLAQLFAPIIRQRLESEAREVTRYATPS